MAADLTMLHAGYANAEGWRPASHSFAMATPWPWWIRACAVRNQSSTRWLLSGVKSAGRG
jgi:hypothetical protein